MKIGVYVGSFDPIHKGHINIINHLMNKNYVDKIILIATGSYWNKKNSTAIIDRIEMLKCYQNENIIVDETLNDKEYTYQIMNELQNRYPTDTLYLIIGADNIKQFHLWKKVDDILQHHILVLPRNGIDVKHYIDSYHLKEQFTMVDDFDTINISSTLLRKAMNCDSHLLHQYLDRDVLNYIKKKHLYHSNLSK